MKPYLLWIVMLVLLSAASSLRPAEAACTAAPQAGCRVPATAHRSTLGFVQTGHTDPDDIFTWKWRRGSQTTVVDFGNPPTATDYVFCLYDQSARPQPLVEDAADDPLVWKAVHNGFVYHARDPHALRSIRLHAGSDDKASISAHGDSTTIMPLVPFTPPVIVQLQASNGECWETDFTAPSRNNASSFLAKD